MNDISETESKDLMDKALSKEELLKIAKERFHLCEEAESENRKEEIDDLKFMVGDQWPLQIRNQRITDSRPCLTINRIPQYVRQITNDQRQNRPSIKINPVDDRGDVETAKVFSGIIRHIEYSSHADIAYDTAFESAVKHGLGYFRLITEYQNPMSFQQEIKVKRVKDRFSVYMDPFYQEPDGSDANYGFIFDTMSRDEFRTQYPDAELSRMSDWTSLEDSSNGWIRKDEVRVAEYFYKVFEEKTIVHLTNGKVLLKEHIDAGKVKLPEGVSIRDERKTLIPKIKWAKINGVDVLDETEVPGEWIPIIPIIGEENIVEGKRILSGIIRHAKDPQRMYNYYASAATEMIALAPKAPYIGAEGQFEGHAAEWKTANIKNHAYLEYKGTTIAGQPAPPPQRTQFDPQIQSITNERAQSAQEFKDTTGMYDATLGNRSNEQSGVAIQRRNIQSQTSNFHFMDNLSRSLRHAGRIMVNWIPKVYSASESVRIIGDDGEIDFATINKLYQTDGDDDEAYDLDSGCYDVTVDTGPSYQTKRQEAVTSMLDLARSVPGSIQPAMDIVVRHMDWNGAQEIADRIKKTLPPQLTSDDKDQPQIPPQVQQQLQQLMSMNQTLTQHLNENTKIIETKQLELQAQQLELASKERIAAMNAENALVLELLKHNAKDGQIAFQEEMREIQHVRSLLNKSLPINNGNPGDMSAAGPTNDQPQPAGGINPAAQGAQQ